MSFLDLSNVEVQKMEPLPDGLYLAQLDKIEVRTVDNKPELKGLNMSFKILEGDYQNRMAYDTFYYEHSSDKAAEIAKQKIKQFILASGKSETFEDPKELVGGKCMIKLKSREYNDKKYQQIAYFKEAETDESEGMFA